MTFVGKIFTVLIFVFSLVMMSLALMVAAAHKNWKDYATWPAEQADAQHPTGLEDQLAAANEKNKALQLDNDNLRRRIASEVAARRIEVAKLEAAQQTLSKELEAKTAENQKNVDALGTANEAMTVAETALADKQKKLDDLRDQIRAAMAERDKTLLQVVDVSDKNHQLRISVDNLKRRGIELVDQIAKYRALAAAYNLDINSNVTGIPPRVEGLVKNVRNNGQDITVLVSVGEDDGLRVGHEMNVFRGDSLVGRIRLVRVDPDRAVGESDPLYYKRPFQIGDVAKTFQPSASLDRQANNRR